MQYSKLLPKIQTQNFWFCTVNCTVVALSRLRKTGFASACVAWGFFHERGGPSYQSYCKIDAVTCSPPSHGSLHSRICFGVVILCCTRWGAGYCINFAVVLIRRPPPFMKKSSGYTGRSKTSFAQPRQGSNSTICCTKSKILILDFW